MTDTIKAYIKKLEELIWNYEVTFGLLGYPAFQDLRYKITDLKQQIEAEEIMLNNWKHLPEGKYKDHGWKLPDGNDLARVKGPLLLADKLINDTLKK